MDFPDGCNTNEQKYRHTCNKQKRLKVLHNVFAKWHTQGLSEQEYADQIPAAVATRFPYVTKLSKAQWLKFYRRWRQSLNDTLSELSKSRASVEDEFADSDTFTVDLKEI